MNGLGEDFAAGIMQSVSDDQVVAACIQECPTFLEDLETLRSCGIEDPKYKNAAEHLKALYRTGVLGV